MSDHSTHPHNDCTRFADWLVESPVGGDASPWQAHLDSCTACRGQWVSHQMLVATFAAEHVPELSPAFQAGLDRKSFLVALGGGVIGDLAGFAAAIFQRGIPCVQIPTTVVSLVDSSVGGKTGVNTPEGKNLVGAFHQPKLVIADVETLKTLPDREYNEGYAEVIKHAAIRDTELLGLVENQGLSRDDLATLIARNVGIKARVVEEDERETTGTRALLNFGPTIGHGIEAAGGYGKYFHGEAISLGLVAAWRIQG